MSKIIRLCLAVILLMAWTIPDNAMAFWRHHPYRLTATTAILWDPVHNLRYFDLRADREVYPASTTKVMTAILVLEKLSLDQYVTVPAHATEVPETKLGLRAGETYRVRDLLYGLILKSANDAAVALAQAVAGSQEKFATMMNAKASEIGATHTHFVNPHGLPSNGRQYTTAFDMALIFKEALKFDFFRGAVTLKYHVIYSKAGRRFLLKSHNKALFFNWKRHVFGKTGWTIEAQSCFVGYIPRGTDILVVGIFGAHRRWTDMKYIIEHYGHINL